MPNPFRYGQIVREADFCPRPVLEQRLRSCFRSGQNVVLYGERRVGKSSLIHRAAAKTRGKRLLYIDLLGIKSLNDLLTRTVQALEPLAGEGRSLRRILKALSRFGVSVSINPVTGSPTFRPTYAPESLRADNLRQLGSLWKELDESRPLIVAMDEFQDILAVEEAEAVLAVLRSVIQQLGEIPFCYAGSVRNDMLGIFSDEGSPFFKSAVAIEVLRDDFHNWEEFLIEKFRAGRRKIDRETLHQVIELVDGSPGDVQQLCAAIWDVTERGSKIDEDDLEAGLAEVFRNEQKGYDQILATVTAQQLNVLRALAQLGGASIQSKEFLRAARVAHASSSKAAATRLEARRVIFREGKLHRFSNPFLRLWLLRTGY